jgi:hypothetical protein
MSILINVHCYGHCNVHTPYKKKLFRPNKILSKIKNNNSIIIYTLSMDMDWTCPLLHIILYFVQNGFFSIDMQREVTEFEKPY